MYRCNYALPRFPAFSRPWFQVRRGRKDNSKQLLPKPLGISNLQADPDNQFVPMATVKFFGMP
jgi:hypothetical protein